MSTLRVNTLQNAAGTSDPAISGAAKAWVNFNGTNTVAIRASFNVSSITDNNTGDYTVNFTSSLTDANASVVGTAQRANTNHCILSIRGNSSYDSIASSSARVRSTDEAGNLVDPIAVCVSVFR